MAFKDTKEFEKIFTINVYIFQEQKRKESSTVLAFPAFMAALALLFLHCIPAPASSDVTVSHFVCPPASHTQRSWRRGGGTRTGYFNPQRRITTRKKLLHTFRRS